MIFVNEKNPKTKYNKENQTDKETLTLQNTKPKKNIAEHQTKTRNHANIKLNITLLFPHSEYV